MLKTLILSIILLFIFAQKSSANKKVLIFSSLRGHSNLKFTANYANVLVEEGYNVTVVMPIMDFEFPLEKLEQMKKVKDLRIIPFNSKIFDIYHPSNWQKQKKALWKYNSILGFLQVAHFFSDLYAMTCEHVFQQFELIEDLREMNFDVGIAEPLYACGFALLDHLKIPTRISMDCHTGLESVKMAHNFPILLTASFLPPVFSNSPKQPFSFKQRIRNLIDILANQYYLSTINKAEMDLISKNRTIYNGENDWMKLFAKTTLNFVNSNRILDFASFSTNKFVEIGGFGYETETKKKERKIGKLDEKFDEILNLRSKNVLISFGSVTKSKDMPIEMKKSLIKVFQTLSNITFIWKYEEKQPEFDLPSNVFIFDWIPQSDLLQDSRLSIFITHGGISSIYELIQYGAIPSITIPIFGDQGRNSRMLEKSGISICLSKYDLIYPNIIIENIQQIMENQQEYLRNAKRVQKMLESDLALREKFVQNFKFAVEFGRMDLDLPEIPTFQYYFLDLLLVLMILGSCFILGFALVFRKIKKLKLKID